MNNIKTNNPTNIKLYPCWMVNRRYANWSKGCSFPTLNKYKTNAKSCDIYGTHPYYDERSEYIKTITNLNKQQTKHDNKYYVKIKSIKSLKTYDNFAKYDINQITDEYFNTQHNILTHSNIDSSYMPHNDNYINSAIGYNLYNDSDNEIIVNDTIDIEQYDNNPDYYDPNDNDY